MSEVEINSYLHFAQRIILEVGGLIREGYYRHKEIASKDGRELVTSADIASERFLHSQILATYPDHKILSEELSDSQGTDVENLWVSQPDSGEQALEITESLVRSGAMDIIVIDSVAALVPRAEIEGDMSDVQVGLQARLMSKALRKLTSAISKSKTAVVFVNQTRMKVGMMHYGGSPETTSGGLALKFYSSVRIDIRRVGSVRSGDEIIGMKARARVVKNKVAPPFRKAEFEIIYGEGISREGELIDMGIDNKIISRSGPWYSYGDTKLGQGKEAARQFLKENRKVAKEVEQKVKEKLGLIEKKEKPTETEKDSQAKKSES